MKFEYGLLEFQYGLFTTKPDSKEGTFRVLTPDGKHPSQKGKVGTLMADLGRAGWELISADSMEKGALNKTQFALYTFKRQIE